MVENLIAIYLFENLPFTIVLICHFLGDFQFQSQTLACQKKKKFSALCLHMSWVALPMCFFGLFLHQAFLSFFFKVWLAHFAIDFVKYFLTKNKFVTPSWDKYLFLIDQFLHLSAIYFLYSQNTHLSLISHASQAYPIFPILLFFVLITKPVNIVFKLFFSKYQPDEVAEVQTTKAGAGALIGQLERLVMAIFLIWGQYAAIGLVFTAKSIARFDRISKDQSFAEYYLIGSLFSIISVLALYALLIL